MDTIAASVPTLKYLRGLPTRDGWVRPDPARAPLTLLRRMVEHGVVDLRGTAGGTHEVKITADGLRALLGASL